MRLPIDQTLPELLKALGRHPNVVLQAPPGAGKTTRVPPALLHQSWLGKQKIILLEPRRLAARNAAHFMAASLGEQVGQTVGYRVRLDSRVGPATRIEVVTEGVLTRMLQADPALEGVGLVIFDEFHERSLQADLGLALCLESQAALRDDLKILVMSATLDGAAVAKLLGDAPVVASEGRGYPVEVRYAPPPVRHNRQQLLQHVAAVTSAALHQEHGSALVFLPGSAEIRRVEQLLRAMPLGDDIVIAPLYGELPLAAQELAIQPPPKGQRKLVLATNIAETSLTIEGIRTVIDAGLARVPRFEAATGLTRLETVNISQAAAEQRRGRAGRLEAGNCYRLWHAGRHLLAQDSPEILAADLAPLALELARWGCRDPEQLRWLDPPPSASYQQALALLRHLGAVDAAGRITAHGEAMAELPLPPRLGHMVLRGEALGAGRLACQLAALLSERDPLRRSDVQDSDLHSRLALLQDDTPAARLLQHIRRSAHQLQRQRGIGDEAVDLSLTGVLLGCAYPDRIAQRRPGEQGRYRLANGRGACFAAHQALANEPWLVIASLAAGEREAHILLAAAIDADQIETHFADLIESRASVRWEPREQAVWARQQRRFDALVLDDTPLEKPDPELVRAALIDGIRQNGLRCLPWSKATQSWRSRVRFLQCLDKERWPDVSDAALLERLEEWLAPFLTGMSRLSHLEKLDLQPALNILLPWPQQRQLDELAPTHIQVPSGSRIAIDYNNDPPILAVRLQEMFGHNDTPTIANGKVKLLLQLLSPAQRPVQVTQDLKGFWNGSGYVEVKKDMKGRYPKHYWPDDPLQAEPTSRTKPRNS